MCKKQEICSISIYQQNGARFNDAQDKFRKNTKTWRELLPDLESAIKL